MEENTGCYCEIVTFKPCPYCLVKKPEAWEKLTVQEKTTATAYKRLLMSDKEPPRALMVAINALYAKYEDFDIGVVP